MVFKILNTILCVLRHPQSFYIGFSEREEESEKVYGFNEQQIAYDFGKKVRHVAY